MPRGEPVVLGDTKIGVRLIGVLSVVWKGVSTPLPPEVSVLGTALVARPLVDSGVSESSDLLSASYTSRLGDAGEGTFNFPNAAGADGILWRSLFNPQGHLQAIELSLNEEIEGVYFLDTVAVDDGQGFASTVDATDQASSLQGNGAGFQNGTVGQLQGLVYDPATLGSCLFDLQAWDDNSDASFPQLLAALLNSQLGLRLSPWQLLSTDGAGGGTGMVVVHGQDGMFLLKKAYERDWTVIQSPRDVIERGTMLWVPTAADNFPASSQISGANLTTPYETWTISTASGGTVTVGASGGIVLTSGVIASSAGVSITKTVVATGAWSASASFSSVNYGGGGIQLIVSEAGGVTYTIQIGGIAASFLDGVALLGQATFPSGTSYNLALESDGEWVLGFINGQLVGYARRANATATTLGVSAISNGGGSATLNAARCEALQPFLQPGSDKGDYVLPGAAGTYPNGGLHARYFNNADLQGNTNRLLKIHAPPRTQAYSGSGTSEYQNQPDATINAQANPTPGAANAHWSCIWFGSIYLKLSAGSYTFSIVLPAHANNQAVRAWIGKTQFGTQLVDKWAYTNTSGQTYSFTVSAAALAGALGYDRGTVQRDGWYPIKIEYAVDGTNANAPTFNLTNSPVAYTDPGGTAIASGAQTTVVPATSLSPLGCVDQRYQAVAHFDLVQQTLQAFGYQASVEPKQLESGLFPGVLAPRIREGQDYATILQPDKSAAQDGQMLMRPQQEATWPLPGSVAKQRWRPGDAMRVQDRDINVFDTTPRQILTFTRNLLPTGIASALASFANRPLTRAKILKQQLYTATRQQRNYQKQLTELSGTYVQGSIAAGANGSNSLLALNPGDVLVSLKLAITTNTGSVSFNVLVNGVDATSTLNGPWTTVPLTLDLLPVTLSDNRVFVAVTNNSGTTASNIQYQVLARVQR